MFILFRSDVAKHNPSDMTKMVPFFSDSVKIVLLQISQSMSCRVTSKITCGAEKRTAMMEERRKLIVIRKCKRNYNGGKIYMVEEGGMLEQKEDGEDEKKIENEEDGQCLKMWKMEERKREEG
ncbi:hypothetical protein DM860_018029 [Cuscuta australis]|uniref:Uncharacterized protein n=1 Tax=Cuscuta australis TaxID=267555 RepID=A0A328DF24_9ASTE|nr:hypothetical protein DM860_018029 [Cuscuta australis]